MRAVFFEDGIAQEAIERDKEFPHSLWYPMNGEKCDTVKVDYFPIFFYLFFECPVTDLIPSVPRRRFIAE